jgi:LacI family transcriptional regulator
MAESQPGIAPQPGIDSPPGIPSPPTIYDVARAAGVSIASVSRVLNGHRNPRPETRDRVLQAVSELGFVPDGAARALSARLKEVVGVVFRRVPWVEPAEGAFTQEDESLQFTDVINRGIEVAAQRGGYNLLVGSVEVDEPDAFRRIMTMARKSDGLILHDQALDPSRLAQLSQHVPVVTLAGVATQTTANVRSDSSSGMTELARHLVVDHGYLTIAYLAGHADSPDNVARRLALAEEAAGAGVLFVEGPQWQGNYLASGGAKVITNLLADGVRLPRAIVCANDQTALGAMHALGQHGIDVPGDVAVTGFDDIPVARHMRPQLTTIRQPIHDLGATAFETLRALIDNRESAGRDVVLPTRLVRRESCGCQVPHDGSAPGLA